VNAPRPENLGRVIRIREVAVVAFKIVDAHGRSVGQMRPLPQTREMGCQSTGLLSRCSIPDQLLRNSGFTITVG
jgi:hypothetical protein